MNSIVFSSDPLQEFELLQETVIRLLYDKHNESIPCLKQVTICLKEMEGVAHTFGSETHKTIEISSCYLHDYYIKNKDREALIKEIRGIFIHEMVHVWQYNGFDTADGGLIEGIADYVRLKSEFIPPHWKKSCQGKWNQGYSETGYFLDWIQVEFKIDFVQKLNSILKTKKWNESLFEELSGMNSHELWTMYKSANHVT